MPMDMSLCKMSSESERSCISESSAEKTQFLKEMSGSVLGDAREGRISRGPEVGKVNSSKARSRDVRQAEDGLEGLRVSAGESLENP